MKGSRDPADLPGGLTFAMAVGAGGLGASLHYQMLFLHMFGGQAIGAISGSITWAHYGWTGVMTLCVAFAVAAIGVHLARR